VQIDLGKTTAAELGLSNVDFRYASITDVGPDWGKFDYIICHGVYSWVPEPVKKSILGICRENLSPNGIAYVSYNVKPGWAINGVLRDMMIYHARKAQTPQERLHAGKALLQFLSSALQNADGHYAGMIKTELGLLEAMHPSYLFHEYMEDVNTPMYFHEFIATIEGAGLRYVGDAHFSSMWPDAFTPAVSELLRKVSQDSVELEQYMDLLSNRLFRRSLLCRGDVTLRDTLDPGCVREMFLSTQALPDMPLEGPASAVPTRFRSPEGLTLTTTDPVQQAALLILGENWPGTPSFAELVGAIGSRLDQTLDEKGQLKLAANLLGLYARALIDLHVERRRVANRVNPSPMASPWTRHEATRTDKLTDLTHQTVEVTDMDRLILLHLDGTRDRAALAGVLKELVASGQLSSRAEDPSSPAELDAILNRQVEQTLSKLARQALLLN
jgi:methyltransferase-like protein